MFEVGKDIFKHGVFNASSDRMGRRRMRIVYYVFVMAFVVFAGRTLWLGIEGTDRSRRSGSSGEWVAERADIVDRNGDILAKNIASGHIILRTQAVEDVDAVANAIHQAMPYKYSLNQAFELLNSGRRFVYLEKYASDAQREIVQNAKQIGLEIEDIQKRRYPKRRLFSHAVGFVGSNGHGLDGAERTYDDYLNENMDPLQLSLDSRIQAVFYDQLSIAMQKYQAKSAMGMLINSRTGEMIAMVSLPDYDPENIGLDSVSNRMFLPMRGVYEMGSTFKIFN